MISPLLLRLIFAFLIHFFLLFVIACLIVYFCFIYWLFSASFIAYFLTQYQSLFASFMYMQGPGVNNLRVSTGNVR